MKQAVLLICVSYSALTSVFAVREKWVVCYLYMYATLRVLNIMCTNPYRMDTLH